MDGCWLGQDRGESEVRNGHGGPAACKIGEPALTYCSESETHQREGEQASRQAVPSHPEDGSGLNQAAGCEGNLVGDLASREVRG